MLFLQKTFTYYEFFLSSINFKFASSVHSSLNSIKYIFLISNLKAFSGKHLRKFYRIFSPDLDCKFITPVHSFHNIIKQISVQADIGKKNIIEMLYKVLCNF